MASTQNAMLCIGNLPKFMHQKLESELKKFFSHCHIQKVHLLTGKNYCFIRFRDANSAQEAMGMIKTQAFNGKVLKVESRRPEDYLDKEQLRESRERHRSRDDRDSRKVEAVGASGDPRGHGRKPKGPPPPTQSSNDTYILEVLELPSTTRQSMLMEVAYGFGVKECRVAPPLAKLWVMQDRREEVYANLDGYNFMGRRIKVRYPLFTGDKPTTYSPKETCRIIVEGIVDPDAPKVTELLTARFAAYGTVSGVEILRNRKPCCAFIDIERNMADVAVKETDGELFFGGALTVALMKQDDVIVIDSEEEAEMNQRAAAARLQGGPPLPPGKIVGSSSIPGRNVLPDKVKQPSANDTNKIVELMCERERLEVLHPYEEYLLQVAPPEGSIGLDDAEPLPNPPQQFIRLLMDRALTRVKLMKLVGEME